MPDRKEKAEIDRIAKLSDAEKREHYESLSESFIEEHSEDANNLRLCIMVDQNWMGLDHWVD